VSTSVSPEETWSVYKILGSYCGDREDYRNLGRGTVYFGSQIPTFLRHRWLQGKRVSSAKSKSRYDRREVGQSIGVELCLGPMTRFWVPFLMRGRVCHSQQYSSCICIMAKSQLCRIWKENLKDQERTNGRSVTFLTTRLTLPWRCISLRNVGVYS
jgi:hypothetical protein